MVHNKIILQIVSWLIFHKFKKKNLFQKVQVDLMLVMMKLYQLLRGVNFYLIIFLLEKK